MQKKTQIMLSNFNFFLSKWLNHSSDKKQGREDQKDVNASLWPKQLSPSFLCILFLSFGLSLSLLGCSSTESETDPSLDEFQKAMNTLNYAYGSQEKADFSRILSPCELLDPIFEWGSEALRSGFFMGVSGEGTLGAGIGLGGYDVVWDFYHAQATLSKYYGGGINLGLGAGVSASLYAGWVSGFQHGVSDWDGYHVAISTELSVPFLKEYIHLKPELFTSAEDRNGDALIDPTEIIPPLQGMYGFSIGVGVGLELIPNPIPISASIIEGLWMPHRSGIVGLYDQLKRKRLIPLIGEPLEVSLIDEETGQPCPEDWIEEQEHIDSKTEGMDHANQTHHTECIIQFGRPEWSHLRNALHVAASVCSLSGGCLTPLSWPQSGLALAIGAWRDATESNQIQLCQTESMEE